MNWAALGAGIGTRPHSLGGGGGAGSVCAQVQVPDVGDAVEVGVAEPRHSVGDVFVAPRHVPGYRSLGCRPKYGWKRWGSAGGLQGGGA